MIIDEIAELAKIPEIEDYFAEVLLDVKKKFRDKIREFYRSKDKLDQMEEEKISDLSKAFEKNKTYFFELTCIEDPKRESGVKWEFRRFKLKANGKIMNIIFDDFIEKADQYEVAPHRIQEEIVDVPSLTKKFRINFTKSSSTRVVGFVKEYKEVEEKPGEKEKEEKAEQRLVIRSNRNMLKLSAAAEKHWELEKEELKELLQYNPEYTENVIFSIRMKRAFDCPQ